MTKGDKVARIRWPRTVLVLALGAAAALAAGVSATSAGVAKKKPPKHTVSTAKCTTSIGYVGPLTGAVATVGQEQVDFARTALANWNAQYHTHFKMVEGDDQLNPAMTGPVVQSFVANPSIVAIVGPAGTSESQTAGAITDPASLAMVSMSAGGDQLSGAYKTFFRVISSSRVQAPTDAEFIAARLKPKKVMIVDTQTDFSVPLADAVQKALQARGIQVVRESVSLKQTDYSSIIGTVDSSTGVVFLPWEVASSVQLFGQQLHAQGKNATIFATNGAFSPTQFTIEGSYVSAFSPDIRAYAGDRKLVNQVVAKYGNTFGIYGPPTYVATQVVLNAMTSICTKGVTPTRPAVLAKIRATNLHGSILGRGVKFDSNGDVVGAKYYIFTIKNGKYQLVK